MDVVDIAISKSGVPIRLTYKQWVHIVESHDYMSGNIDLVLESIEDQDYIVRGWTDKLISLKHYEETCISQKYVVVIYKEDGGESFVISAFMTSKKDKILQRGIIWQK